MFLHEGDLFVSAADSGALLQHPAFFGPWTNIYPNAPSGVYGMAFVQDVLFCVTFSTTSGVGNIHRWADETWIPTPDSLRDIGAWSLDSIDSTLVVTTAYRGILISDDEGSTWTRTYGLDGQIMGDIRVQSDRSVYVIGQNSFFGPTLLRSVDKGRTWVSLASLFPITDGRVTSISQIYPALFPVYAYLGNDLYLATSDTSTFTSVLHTSTSGVVLANPDGSEIWVASDSLYQSNDAGASWRAFAPPNGIVRFGVAAADWERRSMAIIGWAQNGPGQVYCVDLEILTSEIKSLRSGQ